MVAVVVEEPVLHLMVVAIPVPYLMMEATIVMQLAISVVEEYPVLRLMVAAVPAPSLMVALVVKEAARHLIMAAASVIRRMVAVQVPLASVVRAWRRAFVPCAVQWPRPLRR
jgi:hypothetical protein